MRDVFLLREVRVLQWFSSDCQLDPDLVFWTDLDGVIVLKNPDSLHGSSKHES